MKVPSCISCARFTLSEEGFEVRHLVKVVNKEKTRVKQVYAASMKTEMKNDVPYVQSTMPKDSEAYYSRIMQQSDQFDILNNQILRGDSIAYAVDSVTAGLDFADYLYILYKNKKAPSEYWTGYKDRSQAMISQLTLINGHPVEIESNGHYGKPIDLLNMGYWSWSEKLGSMLPFDYVPKRKR
jgi:hypothetical protein